jgi:hypothetical protein
VTWGRCGLLLQAQKAFDRGDEVVDLSRKDIRDAGGVKVAAMLAASTPRRAGA